MEEENKQKEPQAEGDLRVRRTKKMLREALIELVLEKGIEGITVNEITERAMINRSTFYRHYEDKNDLLERGIDEMLLELTDQLVPPPKDIQEVDLNDPGSYDNLRLFYNHVKEHYTFYRVMLGENGPPGFRIRLVNIASDLTRRRIQSMPPPVKAQLVPNEVVINIMGATIVDFMSYWVLYDTQATVEDMIRSYTCIFMYGIYTSLGFPHPKPPEEFKGLDISLPHIPEEW
jgi:AcrR family transcriptional regulator